MVKRKARRLRIIQITSLGGAEREGERKATMMPRVAMSWRNGLIMRIPWRTRALNTLNDDVHSSRPIIVSPPLVSLDIPDDWTPSPPSSHFDFPINCSHEQTAAVIDGKSIADDIRSRIGSEVRRMKESIGMVPGLGVIMVGQRKDSETYVRNKMMACEEVGIKSNVAHLPEHCTKDQLLKALSKFDVDPSVHGILVQLPLPQHLDERKIMDVLSPEKDVDGFHPINMGNLAMRGREPMFIPCTPKGCIELLLRSGVEIVGKKAAVIGRSNIVGLPASLLLQRHHATVSIVHAFTKNPEHITCEADIVVTAAGVPNLVRGNWLKPGAVVIDVGTNPVVDPSCERGYRLIGDVCYEEAVRVVSAITPVPGGVGPMTIAMLLSNTLDSAKRAYAFT
ncbi:putative methylenetetrahydrofolate dehydrogenase (NADP(+)), Methenyltetrahydrofolate cyclohydrolase [Rosa chinensis]|uniref:Putative methylenetetrahydrofolate dehydrogenase (NADP(+)), Methenyltetrahydrofolate cyclohydrolase n=1 Tax=Rosa chinensis TaxID=74649 RepID=A0A2P6R855_ROSCH|nr:bifunctional protein FolD 1, mitochondrial [Rosa chinensis]PRQ42589.1 putative methylenetetrahydrofolate dehydrogenase (NADP(+)), Methenyltetrahydrofolate cyclohydrolase [Rosa chinensis]